MTSLEDGGKGVEALRKVCIDALNALFVSASLQGLVWRKLVLTNERSDRIRSVALDDHPPFLAMAQLNWLVELARVVHEWVGVLESPVEEPPALSHAEDCQDCPSDLVVSDHRTALNSID